MKKTPNKEIFMLESFVAGKSSFLRNKTMWGLITVFLAAVINHKDFCSYSTNVWHLFIIFSSVGPLLHSQIKWFIGGFLLSLVFRNGL